MNIRAKSESVAEDWWQETINKFTDQKRNLLIRSKFFQAKFMDVKLGKIFASLLITPSDSVSDEKRDG